jgi:hypothetical protein
MNHISLEARDKDAARAKEAARLKQEQKAAEEQTSQQQTEWVGPFGNLPADSQEYDDLMAQLRAVKEANGKHLLLWLLLESHL